jgi:hypothetical protein
MNKGVTFKYDNQVWLVIGNGVYDGFYRCINPQGEIRQFNKYACTVIGKYASS